MKERILKSQNLKYLQQCAFADFAAREALNALESEGTFTLANYEMLWGTAWSAAFNAFELEDATIAESIWLAMEAARKHAATICGWCMRREHIKAGRITPAWMMRLAQ